MSTVSATIPITASGQKIPLNPPNQPSIYYTTVAIYNASGYLLTVNLPGASQDFVNPSTAALFTLTGNASVTVTATAVPGLTLPTNNVWAVFYEAQDTPGTFPVGLPAPGTIGLESVADPDNKINGAAADVYSALPWSETAHANLPTTIRTIDFSHIVISESGSYGGVYFTLTGNVSGHCYLSGVLAPGSSGPPQSFQKTFPRGIALGDTVLVLTVSEIGSSITGWSALWTCDVSGIA